MKNTFKKKRFWIQIIKIAILAILTFVIAPAISIKNNVKPDADGYIWLATGVDGTQNYVNIVSFRKDPNFKDAVDVWFKYIYPSVFQGADSDIEIWAINCKNNSQAEIQVTDYLKGKIVYNPDIDNQYYKKFVAPMPSSLGSVMQGYVCSGQIEKDHKSTQTFWQKLF